MKIDKCLISFDLNENYTLFYPLVKKYWKQIVGIETILILIADHVPEYLTQYSKDIILFKPIENIPYAFQAQCIRLLYPCLFQDQNIIISDADLIPLNRKYYVDNIENLDDSNFIVYRDVISEYKQYPMCFCLAKGQIWKEIFEINNEDDIRKTISCWYSEYNDYMISSPYSSAWAADQYKLFDKVNSWNKNVIKLKDENTGFNRIDKHTPNLNYDTDFYKKQIENGIYSDFHLLRPFNKYKELYNSLNITH